MFDLVQRTKAALVNPNGSLWFPELTAELAEAGWKKLYCTAGISRPDYATSRVMMRDVKAPCRFMVYIPIGLGAKSSVWVPQVEILDGELASHYEESGISLYTAEEIDDANILNTLGDGLAILKRLPSLYATIATLVKSIHIIKLADDDYDVSFSEPCLPFSIFVSVPRRRDDVNALRVAEAVAHEAMHLQLTLIEQILPLIKSTSMQYYSPWRDELRNTQGVLHGLYVFCVIDELLSCLSRRESAPPDYIERRLSEIHAQIENIGSIQESEDLTEVGVEFIRRMIFHAQQKPEGITMRS